MKPAAFSTLMMFLISSTPLGAQQTSGFAFTEDDQGVLVREGNRKVLFYQRAVKSFDGKFARAHYVHPLYDLDGNLLSEDFPADHRHHRGIFWAWHQVWVGNTRAGDPWVCEDFVWDIRTVDPKLCDDGTAELRIRVHWKSPRIVSATGEMTPLVDETAIVRIHPLKEDRRAIDFSFRLIPLVPDVRIGGSEDEKGYGGFCARIVLPEDLRFVSTGGAVHPQTMQIEAGPWMDMSGTFSAGLESKTSEAGGAGLSGVAILGHPTLPGHVQPWILRNRHSMQNAVWPGREPTRLSHDQPLEFHYRVLLHRGDAQAAKIAERYHEFAAEKPRLAASAE